MSWHAAISFGLPGVGVVKVAQQFVLRLVAAVSLGVLPELAIGKEISCPSTLLETPTAKVDDSRWVLVLPTARKSLDRVELYLGNPPELGEIVPASTRKTVGATQTLSWKLLRDSSSFYWVGCSYSNTTAMLFRRVDSNANQCAAIYDLSRSGEPQFNSMICK